MMSSACITLPKGLRFQPSDEDLLSDYLDKKNQRKDLEIKAIISEIKVLEHKPGDLAALVPMVKFLDREWEFTMADSPDMERYFYSPRVFKHSKSKSTRSNRTTEEGYWKKQGKDRRITRARSDEQIGGKRILTFYLPDKQKTDWVIHEYYVTKPNSDEQIGDFVLCRLKNKSGKSDHDQQDDPLCDGGEPNSGSCSMVSNVEDQGSTKLGTVLPIPNGNNDEAEYGGGSCSMAFDVENQASKQLENDLPIPNGNDNEAEHGSSCLITPGLENEAAAFGMLTEEEINQTFKELIDAVWEYDDKEQEVRGSQTDPCYIDKNDLSIYVKGQPADRCNSSDSDMVEELLDEPGHLALPLYPPPPPNMFEKPLDEPENLALPLTNVEDQGSKELATVLPIPNGNNDEAEHGGGSCSMAFDVENQASKQLENDLLIRNGNDNEAEHGSSCLITPGLENEAAAFGMLTEEEINQTFKELIDAVWEYDDKEQEVRGSQTDPCYIDKNDLSIYVKGQPADRCNSSDSDMVEEARTNMLFDFCYEIFNLKHKKYI